MDRGTDEVFDVDDEYAEVWLRAVEMGDIVLGDAARGAALLLAGEALRSGWTAGGSTFRCCSGEVGGDEEKVLEVGGDEEKVLVPRRESESTERVGESVIGMGPPSMADWICCFRSGEMRRGAFAVPARKTSFGRWSRLIFVSLSFFSLVYSMLCAVLLFFSD